MTELRIDGQLKYTKDIEYLLRDLVEEQTRKELKKVNKNV